MSCKHSPVRADGILVCRLCGDVLKSNQSYVDEEELPIGNGMEVVAPIAVIPTEDKKGELSQRVLINEVCQKCGIVGYDHPNFKRTLFLVSQLRLAGKIPYTGECATRRIGCCVYIALKEKNKPVTLKWLCSTLNCELEKLGADLRDINVFFNIAKSSEEFRESVNLMSPKIYIDRAIDSITFPDKNPVQRTLAAQSIGDLANRIIDIAEKELLTIGRDPSCIAAAAVVISSECKFKTAILDAVFDTLCVRKNQALVRAKEIKNMLISEYENKTGMKMDKKLLPTHLETTILNCLELLMKSDGAKSSPDSKPKTITFYADSYLRNQCNEVKMRNRILENMDFLDQNSFMPESPIKEEKIFLPESKPKPFIKQEPVDFPFQPPVEPDYVEMKEEKKRKIPNEPVKTEAEELRTKKKPKLREFDEKDLAIQKQLIEGCSIEDILSGVHVPSYDVDLEKDLSDDDESIDEYFKSNEEIKAHQKMTDFLKKNRDVLGRKDLLSQQPQK